MRRTALERLFFRTDRGSRTWPPPLGDGSLFREAEPPPALRAHVAKVRWGHEWIPPEAPVTERIVPDGTNHLLFVLSNDHAGDPYALALGATREATVVQLSGRIEHVEIELRPGAVPALLGIPAGELAGESVPLSDLWRDRAAIARDRLAHTRDSARRIDIVSQTLAAALAEHRGGETPPIVDEALRRVARAAGNLRVRALAAGLGVTERRLEQLFHWHVGLSPKATCRLARLHASLNLLVVGGTSRWADIALERGFFDQSHLVNEFRSMTGLPPSEFQRRAGFGFFQDRPDPLR